MPEISAHPSRGRLSAYNLGQLPPDEAVAIESHISECEPCCDTVISLSSDDTFVGLLKEARELPTDQTADHGVVTAASPCQDIPIQLTEHARYEVLGLIGKGGMGDVYKARHRKMERTVALKVINRGLVRKAEAIDRFHREVKAAAQLSHPNIVTAYDADQAGYFHFMVMEFVDGVDLSQIVKGQGALPIAEACDYIRQAATGLQHAHERGMVHRDIKPHNMMVTADGTIKILDFGLASLAPEAIPASDAVAARSDLTAAGAIMGTPDFISPEQAKDARQVDIRSDIYSLGATLYYLLSGQVPFADGSVTHKLKSHAQFEPVSLDSLRDDLPGELVTIVSKMMAKEPNERYLMPSEVAEALQPFCRSIEPQKAVEPQTQATPRRWRPKFLSLTAAAALFVVAIFAGFTYFLQTDDGEETLRLLQGDWETVSVTEGGKKLAAEDGFDGLLLQIKGNTFVIAERKPDGEKSEVDTGRIEINSTTYPKTIDFIGRAQSTFGIYEFKDGVLRVCLVEQGGTDAPAEERIPGTKPLKRPTTFDSPAGSNMMLMEFQRKQPDESTEQQTRNLLDTTYISNDTVGLVVARPQRILSGQSKVKEGLHQMFAKVAESEGLDVRNLSQIVAQMGPPPLSSRPIRNLFDEQLWTVILRFDEPLEIESYIDQYGRGYRKVEHKHRTYYKHDSRMEMWFPDDRTLILAAERRILSLIDDSEGEAPMASRIRRADPTDDLLLEIDVRQAGPLLLESLPSEMQDPELRPLIEQTLQKIKRITLNANQSSDTPIQARFHAVDAEKANELLAQAVAWLETAKTRWPKLRDLIRERPADENPKLANALADEIDSLLPEIQLTVDEDQLLVRVEKEGGVDLASLLVFFLLID